MFDLRKLHQKFCQHRQNAAKDGKVFLLTFGEWIEIWWNSGHLNERGYRRGQYVMARFGDKGPYAVGNVRICQVSENHEEGLLGNKRRFGKPNSAEVRRKASVANKGKKLTAETKAKIAAAKVKYWKNWREQRHHV